MSIFLLNSWKPVTNFYIKCQPITLNLVLWFYSNLRMSCMTDIIFTIKNRSKNIMYFGARFLDFYTYELRLKLLVFLRTRDDWQPPNER